MPFAAALSTLPRFDQAADEVCSALAAQGIEHPHLAIAFFSFHHSDAAEELAQRLQARLAPRALVGCIGEAVIGNDQEIEGMPALSVWVGKWGSAVGLETFHLVLERTSDGFSLLGWPDALVGADPARSAMLILGDPFTFPTDFFLKQMNDDYGGLRVMGGMASGISGAGQCRLMRDGAVVTQGAVGVLLQGEIGLRPIVSQGCRPIGRHLVITKANESVIHELGGQPPLTHLQELWQTSSEREQQLIQQGLHIGRVINEFQEQFRRGDFLVRNLAGLDRQTGALAITDRVRVGQTVQFHVRDAETADEDLRALLEQDLSRHEKKPAGALVFSCNGRGTRLFPEPHHDAQTVRTKAGSIPLAGFFAMGELGPVGGQNFIHGFTASIALFEE